MRAPFSFMKANGGAPVFDPATLALSGWWRASYAGSPWVAVASAGGSGSNGDLTSAGAAIPSVGASLHGLASADFDGTNDKLDNANNMNTFLASSGWSVSGVIAADSAAARSVGTPQFDAGIFVQKSTGTWGITFTTSGITVFQCDGGINLFEINKACAADGNPHTFHAWFDGTDLHLVVDGGTPASPVTTGGGIFGLASGVARAGTDYAATFSFFDGRIWDLMTSLVDLGGTVRTNIESYFRATYF